MLGADLLIKVIQCGNSALGGRKPLRVGDTCGVGLNLNFDKLGEHGCAIQQFVAAKGPGAKGLGPVLAFLCGEVCRELFSYLFDFAT